MSKVNFSFEKSPTGTPVCIVSGGELNNKYLYLHDNYGISKNKPNKLELGKNKLMKLAPRKYAEVMAMLEEAYRKKIPLEHLQIDIPGAKAYYEEMIMDNDDGEGRTQITLPYGSMFNIVPSPDPKKRQVYYIAGSSGSGKSYISKQLAEYYQKFFPDRPIYLISKLKEDSTLDSMKKPCIRIDTDKLFANPLKDLNMLENSMVIFDDYDTFLPKENKIIQDLINDIAIMGRHQNITMVCNSHFLSNYSKTRLLLMETTHFILFPLSTSSHALSYLLKNYLGLTTQDISTITQGGSRWICLYKNFPMYYITENKAGLINDNRKEE